MGEDDFYSTGAEKVLVPGVDELVDWDETVIGLPLVLVGILVIWGDVGRFRRRGG